MSNPFLFTENKDAVNRLSKKLEDLKLVVHAVQSSESAYTRAKMSINCPWMQEQEIEIVWNRTWWPDGMKMEDEYTTIEVDGSEVWRMDIREMRHRKLRQPLTEEIIQQLVQGVVAVISHKTEDTKT